jgi:hypothetical protein
MSTSTATGGVRILMTVEMLLGSACMVLAGTPPFLDIPHQSGLEITSGN